MFATYLSGFLSHSLFARLIPRWGLGVRGLVFYTSSWISIAVAIRFLDPTLGLLEAGRISIALLFIRLIAVRTLQMHFSNRLLRSLWELYRGR